MLSKINRMVFVLAFLLAIGSLCAKHTLAQRLAVHRQTDGTIKITSTPTKMKPHISKMVFCRAIEELIEEEITTLGKLLSERNYKEAKDSTDIVNALLALKIQDCK